MLRLHSDLSATILAAPDVARLFRARVGFDEDQETLNRSHVLERYSSMHREFQSDTRPAGL